MSDHDKNRKPGILKPTPEQVRERQSGKLAAMMRQRAKATAQPPDAPTPRSAKPLPVIRPACVHEGRIIAPCSSCKGELRHVRDCEVHGTCTRGDAGKEVDAVCATCPDYRAPEPA